jgi:hypothetical protein
MPTLLSTLLDYDPDLLAIIAHRWDVDLEALDKREAAEMLAAAMLDPSRAAAEWGRLSDHERAALQMALGAPEHKMTEAQFSRLFGEIRQMGPSKREREKPHLRPASAAETLYYRGLIALAYDQGKAGMQAFVYVPPDLAAVLPVRQTAFNVSSEPAAPPETRSLPTIEGEFEPETIHAATTVIVDDLTTLLADWQIRRAPADPEALRQHTADSLTAHGLGERQPAAVALLINLAAELKLAANEDGIFRPVPHTARQWLELTRPRQVRALAEAWLGSASFNELWHTPGLRPEDTGWRSDPRPARQTLQEYLKRVPAQEWWLLDDVIELVREEAPDFQRPAGDFDSWYIRDAETEAYLRGFDSWDRVDGAVLRLIVTGPLHWLGLVDLGDDGDLCRLTGYGRAFSGKADWPDPPEDRPHLTLQSDGTMLAPRALSRYERFQLARITEWGAAGDPYTYRLTAAGLRRAAEQGIQPDAIRAFLRRTSGEDLPLSVAQMIDRWSGTAGADVWMAREVILRTSTPEALLPILDTPELRRYLGATLGPTAVIVRAGQEQALAAALVEHGILIEFDE